MENVLEKISIQIIKFSTYVNIYIIFRNNLVQMSLKQVEVIKKFFKKGKSLCPEENVLALVKI